MNFTNQNLISDRMSLVFLEILWIQNVLLKYETENGMEQNGIKREKKYAIWYTFTGLALYIDMYI